MFEGFPREMIEFMLQIRLNNNKEFMSTHREEYKKGHEAALLWIN